MLQTVIAAAILLLSLGLHGAAIDWPILNLTRVGGSTSSPTQITNAHDGSNRLFVVEGAGRIRIIQNGAFLSTAFLDISSKVSFFIEEGMLGVVFPPNYTTKRYFYVRLSLHAKDRFCDGHFRAFPLPLTTTWRIPPLNR